MKKQSVSGYKKPSFLAGAAILAAAASVTGCSRSSSEVVPGATVGSVEETTTSETESIVELEGDVVATIEETTTELETYIRLDGDVAVIVDETTTEKLELDGDIVVIENITDQVKEKTVDKDISLEDYKPVVDGLTAFSIDLFKKSVAESVKNGDNAFISPESVYFALGMTANGAAGDTLSAMLDTLAKTDNIDDINDVMRFIIDNAGGYNDEFKFSIANSVWLDDCKNMAVNSDFLINAKSYYDADVFLGSLPVAVAHINSWVNTKTNSMIPKILDKIEDDVRAILINAICFEGKWLEQYDDRQVKPGKFTKEDGTEQDSSVLRGIENTYIHDDNTTGFMKRYRDSKYAFMAMLPSEGVTISDYVEGMTQDKFTNLFETRKNGKSIIVTTEMPEFKYDYSLSMTDVLKDMGMEIAFNGDMADFSNMANLLDGNLYIGDVIHKTHIELDRNGTKAAAVTLVEMTEESAIEPVENEYYSVILDRPYVYSIVDMQTGMPVFMGVLNSVE